MLGLLIACQHYILIRLHHIYFNQNNNFLALISLQILLKQKKPPSSWKNSPVILPSFPAETVFPATERNFFHFHSHLILIGKPTNVQVEVKFSPSPRFTFRSFSMKGKHFMQTFRRNFELKFEIKRMRKRVVLFLRLRVSFLFYEKCCLIHWPQAELAERSEAEANKSNLWVTLGSNPRPKKMIQQKIHPLNQW